MTAAELAEAIDYRNDRLVILAAELRDALLPALAVMDGPEGSVPDLDGKRADRVRRALARLSHLADACAARERGTCAFSSSSPKT